MLAPTRLLIHNTAGKFDTSAAKQLYAAAKATKAITAQSKPLAAAAVAKWLAG